MAIQRSRVRPSLGTLFAYAALTFTSWNFYRFAGELDHVVTVLGVNNALFLK